MSKPTGPSRQGSAGGAGHDGQRRCPVWPAKTADPTATRCPNRV